MNLLSLQRICIGFCLCCAHEFDCGIMRKLCVTAWLKSQVLFIFYWQWQHGKSPLCVLWKMLPSLCCFYVFYQWQIAMTCLILLSKSSVVLSYAERFWRQLSVIGRDFVCLFTHRLKLEPCQLLWKVCIMGHASSFCLINLQKNF